MTVTSLTDSCTGISAMLLFTVVVRAVFGAPSTSNSFCVGLPPLITRVALALLAKGALNTPAPRLVVPGSTFTTFSGFCDRIGSSRKSQSIGHRPREADSVSSAATSAVTSIRSAVSPT